MAYVGRGLDVGSRVSLDTKRLETLLLRTEETKGKQYKLGRIELHGMSDRSDTRKHQPRLTFSDPTTSSIFH